MKCASSLFKSVKRGRAVSQTIWRLLDCASFFRYNNLAGFYHLREKLLVFFSSYEAVFSAVDDEFLQNGDGKYNVYNNI